MKEQLKILKKHILTGTSHMIPFIVAGGILFSLAVMLNPAGAATPETGWLAGLAQIGLGGLTLFVPVLGGYIAYSIADKPGLAPGIMNGLTNWLSSLGDVGKVPLASILGAMTAFDMGGPVNKVATLFAQTQVDTLPYLMGGVGVAICTPPIGMGIATLLAPKKYNVEEKEAGKAAILMGCVGITEGAIPFAANDPLRVIPSLIVGAVVGNIIPFLAGVLNHAPWGGLIVLPVVEGRIWYFIAVLAGGFVTALMVNLLKRNYVEESAGNDTDLDDLDEITFDEL